MTGCFEFRHKSVSFEFPAAVVPAHSFSKFGKMLRSRSDPNVSPSKKHSELSPKLSPKSSPSMNAPKRRFVRVIRGSNQSDQYHNPHVKRKVSDPIQPKKRDLEALNKRYFSDSDSDSDTQIKIDRDFQRSKSEERVVSPSIPIHSLKKNLSLDVEMGRHARFNEQVDIIGIDQKGKQVYTARGKIQFDNFETCDIRNLTEQLDSCPIVELEGLDPISETPELSKSPPRLITLEQVETAKTSEGIQDRDEHAKEIEKTSKDSDEICKVTEADKDEPVTSSDVEGDKQDDDDEIRPRTSSLDINYQRPLRFIGRLFRSTSDSIMKIGSPRSSPSLIRKKHRYVRVLRDSDHGDEYHNPYVIRKSSSQEHSITGSVDNINERLRPILRKQQSLDLSTNIGKHIGVHAHFNESVEVVEFSKKTKCVNLIDEKHMQESHLKSDDEADSFDDSVSDDVFQDKKLSDLSNLDPGVVSDDSSDDISKSVKSSSQSITSTSDRASV